MWGIAGGTGSDVQPIKISFYIYREPRALYSFATVPPLVPWRVGWELDDKDRRYDDHVPDPGSAPAYGLSWLQLITSPEFALISKSYSIC